MGLDQDIISLITMNCEAKESNSQAEFNKNMIIDYRIKFSLQKNIIIMLWELYSYEEMDVYNNRNAAYGSCL